MGKIDEVKEILNTLRVAMSIFFGLFVLIVGKLVSLYSDKDFSELFWMSITAAILTIIVIALIVRKIAKKNKRNKGFIMTLPTIALIVVGILFFGMLFYSVEKLSEE